jgi:hypothetical protein
VARALTGVGRLNNTAAHLRVLSLGAVALFKFFQAAAWARIITAHIFQWVTYWFFVGMTAAWAMDVAVVVRMLVAVIMGMLMLAVGAVNVGILLHGAYSGT